jgi:hypothetical protein
MGNIIRFVFRTKLRYSVFDLFLIYLGIFTFFGYVVGGIYIFLVRC